MQLFKTEMLFLHPPRTPRFHDPRGHRGLRYGGRAWLRDRSTSTSPPLAARDAVVEATTIVIARGSATTLERAA